jgi:lysophospholipase L1-like esterase
LGGDDLLANRQGEPQFGIPAPGRLPRDVLTQYGVRAVILLEGINDIGANSAEAVDLIQVDRQIITQLHASGLKVYGATLVPFGGSFAVYGANYGTPVGEQQRQILNAWIRTSGAFDGVFDFDKAVRDPQNPFQMLPAYDSGDHLHPDDAGYLAMANAVDLNLIIRESLSGW